MATRKKASRKKAGKKKAVRKKGARKRTARKVAYSDSRPELTEEGRRAISRAAKKRWAAYHAARTEAQRRKIRGF